MRRSASVQEAEQQIDGGASAVIAFGKWRRTPTRSKLGWARLGSMIGRRFGVALSSLLILALADPAFPDITPRDALTVKAWDKAAG